MQVHQINSASNDFGVRDEVAVLARALQVLDVISNAPRAVSNMEIAVATGIPKPSVSRITSTLVSKGLIRQDPASECFELTAAVLRFSSSFLRKLDIRARIKPMCRHLADDTGMTVHVGVRDDLDMVLVDVTNPEKVFFVSRLDVGSRVALCSSEMGASYLASLPSDERQRLLERLRVADPVAWESEGPLLAKSILVVELTGYCVSNVAWNRYLAMIAMTFLGPNGERFTIRCSGPAELFPEAHLTQIVAPRMKACVERIVEEIGGNPAVRGKTGLEHFASFGTWR